MEYVDLINRILSAEHSASAIAQEVKDRQAGLDQDLARESEELRQRYMERARRRVAIVEETEEKAAQASMAAMDKRFTTAMDNVNRAYENHRDQWVDILLSRVTGELS